MGRIIIPERRAPDIYIPKFKEILIEMDDPLTASMGGRFKVRTGKEVGCVYDWAGAPIPGTGRDVVTKDWSPWSDNMVLNNGLNQAADTTLLTRCSKCHVGTGNTAVVATDTGLDNFLTGAGTRTSYSNQQTASAPYYGFSVITYRFSQGVAEGIIAEVGVAPAETEGNLYSRALVSDGIGGTTTVEVLSDEWLDVVYEHRLYPGHIVQATGAPDDATGTVTIDSVSYDYALRPCGITDGATGGWYDYATVAAGYLDPWVNTGGFVYSSDATMGAVTSYPSATDSENLGTSSGLTVTNATYVNGDYNRNGTWTIGITEGNVTDAGGDGIAAMYVRTGMGLYQSTYDATIGGGQIPKDNTKVMTMVWNMAWTRATIP